MKAPITAGVLALEFTGAGPALWALGVITIAGSWAGIFWLERFRGAEEMNGTPQQCPTVIGFGLPHKVEFGCLFNNLEGPSGFEDYRSIPANSGETFSMAAD